MHQTKKGNSWHFGMKMHIGADDALGLIHSIATTSANAHNITQADKLLHGKEEYVWGDAGYRGIEVSRYRGIEVLKNGRNTTITRWIGL